MLIEVQLIWLIFGPIFVKWIVFFLSFIPQEIYLSICDEFE